MNRHSERFLQVPLNNVVRFISPEDMDDPEHLLAKSFPVRESVLEHMAQIYEAFNGYQIDECSEITDSMWLQAMGEDRALDAITGRLRNNIFRDSDSAHRVVVMWFPLERADHPVTGKHQQILTQRALTIPFLKSWPE